MTFRLDVPDIADIVRDGRVDRREIERIVDERIKQVVQTDGIQNYRVTDLGTNRFDASAAASSYPWGISAMTLSSAAQADGWPERGVATGTVMTYVIARGNSSRIWQEYRPKIWNTNNDHIWMRTRNNADTAWEDWGLIAPIRGGAGTSTAHSITTGSTWETVSAMTTTLTDLPDFDDCAFDMEVSVVGVCLGLDTTNAFDGRARLRVSGDNGSTWTDGRGSFADATAANQRVNLSPIITINSLQATDDVVIEFQVWSTQTTTDFDEFTTQYQFHARA